MLTAKADIIARLQKDILIRQGLVKTPGTFAIDMGLGSICAAFPDGSFPLAAVHEFVCTNAEDKTTSAGFIAGLLSPLMKRGGACLWISASRNFFPPAFAGFGITPDKLVFVDLAKEKELLWAIEEALKCNSLSAVVGDIRNLDFTASRRLQLAVEQSRVTGFLLRQTRNPGTTACVSRWKISTAASRLPGDMPGLGFPRWNVELLKIRNGRPGQWQLEWRGNRFEEAPDIPAVLPEEQRKIV